MKYNTRAFLNPKNSSSTGSIVCFDGKIKWNKQDEAVHTSFIEIADCQVKVRLHRTIEDSAIDYIKKIKKIQNELKKYIEHLKNNLR